MRCLKRRTDTDSLKVTVLKEELLPGPRLIVFLRELLTGLQLCCGNDVEREMTSDTPDLAHSPGPPRDALWGGAARDAVRWDTGTRAAGEAWEAGTEAALQMGL